MTLTVEDGAGLPNADSYVSAADAATYAAANGLAWPTDVTVQEAALRRATLWIDATYRARFPGYRLNRRLQSLEWPRSQAYVREVGGGGPSPSYGAYGSDPDLGRFGFTDQFDYLPSNFVPSEIVRATIEAATREVAAPGTLMGDVSLSNGQLKMERAGDTAMEYFPNTVVSSTNSAGMGFPAIDAILFGILIPANQYTARAARG